MASDANDVAGGTPSSAEILALIDKRLNDLQNASAAANGMPGWLRTIFSFFSTGFFFLILGGIFLFTAQFFMASNHAGITFILVVLGVALLLYGTGTQGMGQFQSAAGAGYNVAIAGGAGIVAFAVAYGIIQYSPKMRDAFLPERKFVRLLIQSGDGSSDIPLYASSFEIDGMPIPSARRGRVIEVYVPYVSYGLVRDLGSKDTEQRLVSEQDKGMCPGPENNEAMRKISAQAITKMVSATFYRVEETNRADTLKSREQANFQVRLDQAVFGDSDGGTEYPIYPVRMCVNLQAVDRAEKIIALTGKRELPSAAGTQQPNARPDAIVEAN
jgi:hypothetical protein